MTQAHLDLESQLDSQNNSNISDPSSTSFCLLLRLANSLFSPIQPIDHTTIKQMELHIPSLNRLKNRCNTS